MRGPDRAQVVWFNSGFRVAKFLFFMNQEFLNQAFRIQVFLKNSGFPEEFRGRVQVFLKNSGFPESGFQDSGFSGIRISRFRFS